MKRTSTKTISTEEFDAKFDRGEDISQFLDLDRATVIKKVNVDFPAWMVERMDLEARKLNVSRQAVIKMWVRDRLDPRHLLSA